MLSLVISPPSLFWNGVRRMHNCRTGKGRFLPIGSAGKRWDTRQRSQDCPGVRWWATHIQFIPHSFIQWDSGSCQQGSWKSKLRLPPNVRRYHIRGCSWESRSDVAWAAVRKQEERGRPLWYSGLCVSSVSLALCLIYARILSTSDFVSE